eukprot:1998803-Pyramimonas_sp.AAC.2
MSSRDSESESPGGSRSDSGLWSTSISDGISSDASHTSVWAYERTDGEEVSPGRLADELLDIDQLVVTSPVESQSISAASSVLSDSDIWDIPETSLRESSASGGSLESPTEPQHSATNPRHISVSIPTYQVSAASFEPESASRDSVHRDDNQSRWMKQHTENLSAIREAKNR